MSSGPLIIGNQAGYQNTDALNGALDQFSISNVVRSAAYIAQNSSASLMPPIDANTVLAYGFNEDAGTVAHDLSSNGYNATLSSSSMWTQGPSAPGVTYTPQSGFIGTDTFSYTESNGIGTATGQVTVTVNSASPVANADMAMTMEDTPVSINVLANDSNPSGGALTLTGVTQGANGAVTINPADLSGKISSGQEINAGSVLAFERNEPWTIMVGLDVAAQSPPYAAVIFSNVERSTRIRVIELWIDPTGHLRVRIISNFDNRQLHRRAEQLRCHWMATGNEVAASYDGSSLASGVKIYLDGVQDTATTILANSLTGSIVSSTDGPLIIGNQAGYQNTDPSQRRA